MSNDAGVPQLLRLYASRRGFALWRNNTGACVDQRGRVVRFGLGNESKRLSEVWTMGDLVGIGPGGLFTVVEVKPPGWSWSGTPRERAQQAAIDTALQLGGLGGFATSEEDLERIWARR